MQILVQKERSQNWRNWNNFLQKGNSRFFGPNFFNRRRIHLGPIRWTTCRLGAVNQYGPCKWMTIDIVSRFVPSVFFLSMFIHQSSYLRRPEKDAAEERLYNCKSALTKPTKFWWISLGASRKPAVRENEESLGNCMEKDEIVSFSSLKDFVVER